MFCAFAAGQCRRRHYLLTYLLRFRAVRPPRSSVHSTGQILLPRYLMNGLNNFDKTDKEHLLAPTDDLIRLWNSKVEGQGHSRPWRRHARRRCGIEVRLL